MSTLFSRNVGRSRRFLPCVEGLEGRCVPAVVSAGQIAADKLAITNDTSAIKAQREVSKADKSALSADLVQLKSDKKAGDATAVAADEAKRKADHGTLHDDRKQLRELLNQRLQDVQKLHLDEAHAGQNGGTHPAT